MGDITTVWSPADGVGDWEVAGGALLEGDDLATAALISLFTDRQANADDPVIDGDRRGWWGDPTMGSRLWLLARAKVTDETLRLAEEYAEEALAWMVGDGVVAGVSATAAWIAPRQLGLTIDLTRTDGTVRTLAYAWEWDGIGGAARAAPAPGVSITLPRPTTARTPVSDLTGFSLAVTRNGAAGSVPLTRSALGV